MIYQKQLPIRYETDVLVVGGGAAGVSAAVAAARGGAKVLLVEACGCFGGVGTSGLVPAFAPFTDGVNFLAAGIGLEIRKNVSKGFPLTTYWTTITPEELKREYDRILTEAGVKLLLLTTLCDVVTSGNHIEYAILTSKTGLYAVKAKIYLDCTGDGDMIALAGGKFAMGDENGDVMPPTLCSLWGDIDKSRCFDSNKDIQLQKAIDDGVFTYEDRHLSGMLVNSDNTAGGNLGHMFGTNPLDNESLTAAMIWGRKSMLEYIRFYREYMDGYENVKLMATGAIPGIRESRRITCDYTLDVNDFLTRANFDDEIGRYCYPVDIHVKDTSSDEYERFTKEYETMRYKNGESYGIPLRALIPVSFDNALTAGRCMGTDRQMGASIRVMPGCFITGEAAGTAAAMALPSGEVRTVDPKKLQKKLAENGAYLREELIK